MRILHHMIGGRSSLSAYRSVRKISSSMFRETLSLGSYPVRIGSMGALQACPGSPTCESTCRFSRALCMPLLSVLSAKVASQHTIAYSHFHAWPGQRHFAQVCLCCYVCHSFRALQPLLHRAAKSHSMHADLVLSTTAAVGKLPRAYLPGDAIIVMGIPLPLLTLSCAGQDACLWAFNGSSGVCHRRCITSASLQPWDGALQTPIMGVQDSSAQSRTETPLLSLACCGNFPACFNCAVDDGRFGTI